MSEGRLKREETPGTQYCLDASDILRHQQSVTCQYKENQEKVVSLKPMEANRSKRRESTTVQNVDDRRSKMRRRTTDLASWRSQAMLMRVVSVDSWGQSQSTRKRMGGGLPWWSRG